jgi:hypothetical protein
MRFQASAFVGSFGGFSFLSAFCGVDSVALYSHPMQFLPHHLDVARRVFDTMNGGAFVPLDTAHIALLQDVLSPEQRSDKTNVPVHEPVASPAPRGTSRTATKASAV